MSVVAVAQSVTGISLESTVDPGEWEDLLADDPASTFFHSLFWGRLIESTVAGWERVFLTARDDGALIAAVPAMRRTKRRSTFICSMPFATSGGVLMRQGIPASVGAELADRFIGLMVSARVGGGEFVDFSSRVQPINIQGLDTFRRESRVLDLRPGRQSLWQRLRPWHRMEINKASRAGITARRAESRQDFRDYYRALNDCSKRWCKKIGIGREFFDGLFQIDSKHVHVWLAEKDGRIVGGLINFAFHDGVVNWGQVTFSDSCTLEANHLLHTRAVKEAVDRGFNTYTFPVDPGLPGVDIFKPAFRGTSVKYNCFRTDKPWYHQLQHQGQPRATVGGWVVFRGSRVLKLKRAGG